MSLLDMIASVREPEPAAATLVDILRRRAAAEPDRLAYTFLANGETEAGSLTFARLDRQARAIAAELLAQGAQGERVLLVYPPGLEFVAAFLGCLYAGAVAVPCYPPRFHRPQPRLQSIVRDCAPACVLSVASFAARAEGLAIQVPELGGLRWLATDTLLAEREEELAARWEPPVLDGGSLALLQYTSGSTALPKGVLVTHANLVHNEEMIRTAFGQSAGSVIVSWLPLYHDMGLIGGVLQPLYVGARCVLMSPLSFLQSPARWLEAISRYRGTTSGGPDFAYDLCARKIREEQRQGLDLSSWQVAFDGSEPVRAEVLRRFAAAFAPCGFRREAFYPCYGLAEATLFVTGGEPDVPPSTLRVDAAALGAGRIAEAPPDAGVAARELVSCGTTWKGQEVVIADPASGARCAGDRVGEIWVAGPSVARGYWGSPEATAHDFGARLLGEPERGPFLRTGDLGFLRGGELFVTGRRKDLVIVRGRNHYPQDLELTAERSHPALRPGCGAAFSLEGDAGERLVLVHEVGRAVRGDLAPVAEAVRRALAEEHEIAVHDVVLVRQDTILKTSSGKIQRSACRDAYRNGELAVVASFPAGPAAAESADAPVPGREDLVAASPAERRRLLEAWLCRALAVALRTAPEAVTAESVPAGQGLDSLAAVELAAAIEADLGLALPLAMLLEGRTVAELATDLAVRLETVPAVAADGELSGEPDGEPFPLSHGQRALWFQQRLAPASAAYHIAAAAFLRSEVETAAVERALRALVRRHPALRTTFGERAGEPWQRIQEDLEPEIAGGALPADPAAWTGILRREADRPFDLSAGPPVRAGVWTAPDGERLLLLALHHLVADFRSLEVLARDLGFLCTAGISLPAPPGVRFRDHVRREQRRLEGARGGELWSFWRQRLEGAPLELDLPADRPRPRTWTAGAGAVELRVPARLVDQAHRLARAHHATLYAVLLAGFQALLHRLSGQDDLLVGSPALGRERPEWAEVVGYFVNPLVLRAELADDPSTGTLVERARREVLGALEHQAFPFALLAERLQPERAAGRSPVFQALFVFQRSLRAGEEALGALAVGAAGARLELGELALESVAFAPRHAQLDLTLQLAEVGGELLGSLVYDAALFEAASAERMAGLLQTLLGGMLADPSVPVSALPLLTPGEERQILVAWNDTEAGHPRGMSLYDLFSAQVRRTPDAPALIAGAERLTYAVLEQRAVRLARALRRAGVGPEVRAGVLLERSADLVTALLAVLAAGGAYVPLDPAYPAERLSLMLEDSAAAVLVTASALAGRVAPEAAFGLSPVLVDRLDGEPPAESLEAVDPRHLAYVIYTSGSTGRPKGVAIEHASAVALMHWAREVFPPADLAGVLAATSVCFDLSVFEIFVPLSWGGTVILAENALALPALPAAGEVTLVNTVPSALDELVRGGGLPASVRTVSLAGEPLRGALVRSIYESTGAARVLNLYGPSEDTTYSTWTAVPRDAEREPSIGRPVANTRAYVLDPRGRPVPAGVPGELFLGGAGLARGYLGRPELTAERFVPDPFGNRPGGRLYRTGDLARLRPDGELEFLGRIDHQVKVRGFRIELGEIESALLAQPAVREAVAMACEAAPGDLRLVAWLAPAAGAAPAAAALRAALEQTLPRHAVPSAFVVLEALPRTPNGKVDRRRLPEPSWEAGGADEDLPRGPVEELLAGIWSDLLGVARIGRGASFFELGGHSLLATRMLSRVRETLGVDLPFASVFEAPTLLGLAERIEAARSAPAVPGSAPCLGPAGIAGPRPLSYAQERLWFLDQLEPGLAVYNIPGALRWRQTLNVAALERAFGEIVRRHDILRTRLESLGERPVQVVDAPRALSLPVVDLSSLDAERREAEARRLAATEARRPFDLKNGPLFRTALLRLQAGDHLVLATLHHIASDGWSLSLLLREVAVLYDAFTHGRPSPLPELPLQYSDFALWQRAWLDGDVLERQLDFWRTRLDGAPPALELPTDRPRPPVQSFRGRDDRIALPGELTAALRALGHREGATLFMTLLAGFQALLHVYSGQDDVLVGTPLANRGRAEIEGVIGFFVNTLVIRTDLAENPRFCDLVGRVRRDVLEVHAHQDLPLEKLVEELQLERDLSRTPLFQVVFALQTAAVRLPGIPGMSLAFEHVPTGTSKFDLMLDLTDGPEGVAGYFEHATDLFDAATVERMAAHLLALLRGAAERPDLRVRDLPLLGEAERHQLLLESNDTAVEHAPEGSVHELFARWAERTPDAVAVVGQDRHLQYGELERQANRLAHRLIRLGVGPEIPVALCLERSPELLVGMLGILKAGGAYVPIDPGAPEQRAAFMLQDCRARALVTDARLAARLAVEGLAVVRLDADADRLAQESAARPPVVSEGSHLAYVIYTSGSTGLPKGVGVEHRQLLNYLQGIRRRLDLDGVAHYASVSTFAADLGHTVIFPALCGGGGLHLISQERATDPQALGEYFEDHGIDCLKLVPSHLEALLDGPRPGAVLPRLRLVLGGEAASRELLEKLSRASATCRLFNHYGPTETTVGVITHPVPLGSGLAGQRLPLGRPIPNVQIHLLGPDLQPVPLGVPGELYIGGASVARGYLGRPALTAERFVPDPFAREAGARLYRTGDRARRLPTGELLFLGRMDDQLKFHGYRIEPNEIRSALNRHARVRDSVIVLRKDPNGRDALVAYYVSRQELDPEELRDFLSASVIEETIPNLFVHLKKLPLTLNGKINFQALPGLDEIRGRAQQELVAPRTPTEEELARIWRDVLGLDRVSVHDNFFQLGGHSLLATRVLSRIRETFGIAPPLRTLFEKPTIARLALTITQLQADQEGDEEMARLIQELSGLSGEKLQNALDAEIRLHEDENQP